MTTTNEITAADPLTEAIARLEDPETSVEFVAETMDKLDFAGERYKQLRAAAEAAMATRLKVTGPIEYGDTLWVLSQDKVTKCVDLPGAIQVCLEKVGGDFGQFCQLLSANALKYGAVRNVIDAEDYTRLFKTEVREGAERKAKKLNKRFIDQH